MHIRLYLYSYEEKNVCMSYIYGSFSASMTEIDFCDLSLKILTLKL